jgi:O-antigen biosynthesis protein
MIRTVEQQVPYRENDELYDAEYYRHYNGREYGRNKHWLEFFGAIAENIIKEIKPKTVLDAGCAYGLLVEALRDRDCEAFGVDVSSYALSQARTDIKIFLSNNSILEPLGRNFDLIVSIEMVEHIEEKYCETLIKNMCESGEKILISTIPDDFDDPTHFNVQPPIYWIEKFSQFGFIPDISHDAGYLTPYAILFKKADNSIDVQVGALFGAKKLQDYHLSKIVHQKNIIDSEYQVGVSKIEQLSIEIEKRERIIFDGAIHVKNLNDLIDIERTAREHIQVVFDRQSESLSWRITKPLRSFRRLSGMFSPFKPVLIATNDGISPLSIEKNETTRWAKIIAEGHSANQFQIKVSGKIGDDYVRFSILRNAVNPNEVNWLLRVEPGSEHLTIDCLRGGVSKLSVFQISRASAWRQILTDRWKKGKGFRSGWGLLVRTMNIGFRQGLGAALSSFWPSDKTQLDAYDGWMKAHDGPKKHLSVDEYLDALKFNPLISIILPTYNSDIKYLSEAIESVQHQSYKNWELCIADDASTNKDVLNFLKTQEVDIRIKVSYRSINGHISACSNSALGLATGEFVTFLDHDDKLHPHALASITSYLNVDPNIEILYSDEDKIDSEGNRKDPYFKSDWNPDLLLSQNYICHLAVYKKSLIDSLGGLRLGTEGAQDYDLILRASEKTKNIIHIPHVLYHWRAVSGSTALSSDQKKYAHHRSEDVVKDALVRRSLSATVLDTGFGAYHRVRYMLPDRSPLVSIIIPTRDRIDLLSKCIDGLLNQTEYPALEIIIVDNNSQEPETHAYFESIGGDTVKVIPFNSDFNFSAINNFAVAKSKGEIIVLLNNDVEIIHSDWLVELVSQAVRPEIGAVGCRLYYADNYVQHDGIIIGIGGVAGYANPRLEREAIGGFGRSKLIQNYSAVTAAVLAIRKSTYMEIGGLDEKNLAVAFNDVDFCLRIKEAGYRNLYTPFAELYHHESVSRGPDTDPKKAERFEKEALYMKNNWSEMISRDPFYSPNLSLNDGFKIDAGRGKPWPWEA